MARVVFDEGRVVVVDKDAGVTSEDVAAAFRRKLVHRIDKGTSGLLVLADDARTVQRLQRLLHEGHVERVYRFVARGAVVDQAFVSSLVRDRGDGKRGSGPGGKEARMEVFGCVVVGAGSNVGDDIVTVGCARLVTGRTHQIRIQLAEAGHALVGDRVYGDGRGARLLLHAARLAFTHPNTHAPVVVEAPLPESFVVASRSVGVDDLATGVSRQ